MIRSTPKRPVLVSIAAVCLAMLLSSCGTSSPSSTSASSSTAPLHVTWMDGFPAPGTPPQYNKVGILKVGPSSAKNVLVLEPGTSAGSAYFVPLAKWIVSRTNGWQVWSVERRVRKPMGNERRRPGSARGDRGGEEARWPRGARWPLAWWIDGNGLCHLELRWTGR